MFIVPTIVIAPSNSCPGLMSSSFVRYVDLSVLVFTRAMVIHPGPEPPAGVYQSARR